MNHESITSMKQLTPHPHAALIIEWAGHMASGAVAAGWYEVWTISGHSNYMWAQIDNPLWESYPSYKIVMSSKHPRYEPPLKKIVIEVELTDSEVKKVAERCSEWPSSGMKKLSLAFNKAIKELK